MTKESPKISIVIPAYNEEKYIARCLTALKPQLKPGDEIVVVDNNSSDETIDIAKGYDVKLIKETKQGISYARNRGFAEAKNTIIARTDADTVVAGAWLQTIRDYYAKPDTTMIAITGPVYLKEPRPLQLGLHKGITKRKLGHNNLIGSNMAMHKDLWDKVLPHLRNDDYRYSEDTELSGELTRCGAAINFVPSMVVFTSGRWMWRHPLKYYRAWQRKLGSTVALFK